MQADRAQPALAIGFVGATSAGKSWLAARLNLLPLATLASRSQPRSSDQVSKLQSEGAAQPARFEQSFAGGVGTLSSAALHRTCNVPACDRCGPAVYDIRH